MINKKTMLGKTPEEAGIKDAVHVAIVSVRAGTAFSPGDSFLMKNGEAVYTSPSKRLGVIDPLRKTGVARGEIVWAVLDTHEVPNVRHVWDHPTESFAAPTTPFKPNSELQKLADDLKISYQEVMSALSLAVEKQYQSGGETKYTGPLTEEEFEKVSDNHYRSDLYYEWTEETGYKFANQGSECCPEYDYPRFPFYYAGNSLGV